jgi:hypothetical protein
MVGISPSAAGLLIKLIASQQAQVAEDRNGSSAGMTSTRSTRLLTHRKSAEVAALPRLSVCQIAVVSSRSNMRSQIQLIEQLIGAGEENFSVQASPRSPPTQNRRKVETVTCSICAK